MVTKNRNKTEMAKINYEFEEAETYGTYETLDEAIDFVYKFYNKHIMGSRLCVQLHHGERQDRVVPL